MRYVDEFRDNELVRKAAEQISREAVRPMRFMEVCGTHTMAIARHGIKRLLPDTVTLISGPGCPVCVTPQAHIDRFIAMGRAPETILVTFGDMVRVPGTVSTLEAERAAGADLRVVYSPLDAVGIAEQNPDSRVLFFGIGFETTAPAVALAILDAQRLGLDNFRVLCAHKLIPPAMLALAGDSNIGIDGFICPGHVSAVIGSAAYEPVAGGCGIPCVIAGFEPVDILQSVLMLTRQALEGRSEAEVQYSRAVSREGNTAALDCMGAVFQPCDTDWRGLGTIPASGLRLRPEFAAFEAPEPAAGESIASSKSELCECGLILKGLKSPADCNAFGTACTPDYPLGPCMVSSEGACAAEFRYSSAHAGERR